MQARRLILLVEDEQTLRQTTARGLAKLGTVEVCEAATVREAKLLLERRAPELVISDLDLPDGSGLEVLTEIDRMALRVPVLFVSAFLGKYRSRLPSRADIEVFEKPITLDQLRRLVEDRLGVGVASESSPFTAADYVQLAAMGHHSVVIELRSASVRGRVVVNAGELWSASDSRGHGADAFRRLAFATDVQVTCRTLAKHDLPTRDIPGGGSAESLLLDAARELDEAARNDPPRDVPAAAMPESAPSSQGSSRAPAPSAFATHKDADGFAAAFEDGVDALLSKDYARAYQSFVAASQIVPDDRRVIANLQRLRAMGYS